MWPFRCDHRHIRRVFLLFFSFVRSVMFCVNVTFWIRPATHVIFFLILPQFSQLCDLPYITRLLSSGDLWRHVTFWMRPPSCQGCICPSSDQLCFLSTWSFLFDFRHRSFVLCLCVSFVVTCSVSCVNRLVSFAFRPGVTFSIWPPPGVCCFCPEISHLLFWCDLFDSTCLVFLSFVRLVKWSFGFDLKQLTELR